MRITVENLGAIRSGTFELKPLTVFVGHNNTGKTWAAYGISSIFSTIGLRSYTKRFNEGKLEETYPDIENLIKTLFEKGNANIDIINFFENNGIKFINNIAKLSQIWMNKFLGTDNVSFEKLSMVIIEDKDFKNISRRLLNSTLDAQISPEFEGNSIINIRKEKGNPSIIFYLTENKRDEMPKEILIGDIHKIIFRYIHDCLYYNVWYLPSERTGFVSLSTSQIHMIDDTDRLTGDTTRLQKLPNYSNAFLIPTPIRQMVSLLGITTNPSKFNSVLAKRMKRTKLKNFFGLADVLEKEIMGGILEFEKNETTKELSNLCYKFKDAPETFLELPAVSSTVRDLALLSVYLKCYMEKEDLIIIDEPEMNLHPLAQVKFAELVGMMVNAGLNVILTTHSPYIVDHLSNLIKAKKKSNSKNIDNLKNLFYLKDSNAFIRKDKVGIYLFENRGIKSILDDDGFIDWGTFSKISEELVKIDYHIDKVDDI